MIAWVTGGGTGIGRALAEALCRRGDCVVISGRREDVLLAAARDITLSGKGKILPIAGDVRDPAYAPRVVRRVEQEWGPVELLINNAGINEHHPIEDTSSEEFERTWRINCLGPFLCVKAVLPGLLRRKKGTIVNISSILGRIASEHSPAYSSSKFALAGFSDALRQHLLFSGVHVMTVYPGFVKTAMTEGQIPAGSFRSRLGVSADKMAAAILRAAEKKKRNLYYPPYVGLAVLLHTLSPEMIEYICRKARDPE
jgi:short-subunit dehydrogenase